jgi:hypothetical protein
MATEDAAGQDGGDGATGVVRGAGHGADRTGFEGILRGLSEAGASATSRSDELLARASSDEPPPRGDVMPTLGTPLIDPPLAVTGEVPTAGRPQELPAPRRIVALARSTAVVVLTLATVLCAWLFVLEPLLGSRAVLVRDGLMEPSLRTGDVAIAARRDGPLAIGDIVAARIDGRVVVTRVVDRRASAPGASAEERAAAPVVLLADGQALGTGVEVARTDVIGVVGSAVPRIGLPIAWLRAPTATPLGTLLVLVLGGFTGIGVRELLRERQVARGTTPHARR